MNETSGISDSLSFLSVRDLSAKVEVQVALEDCLQVGNQKNSLMTSLL